METTINLTQEEKDFIKSILESLTIKPSQANATATVALVLSIIEKLK